MNNAVNPLYNQLTASCVQYLAHSPIGESRVIVEFTGNFEAHPVLWQATLVALNVEAVTWDLERSRPGKQYISVSVEDADSPQVEIGLSVDVINEPTVLKAITMLRQYRNLRRGRHEFLGIQKQA